jgi:flagellar operon protein
MMDKMNIPEGQPIRQTQQVGRKATTGKDVRESFDTVIRQEIEKWKGVKFSAHALQRLNARNIQLSSDDTSRIVEAVDRAQAKGARDSLVLIPEAALVVSVTNRTVVTVLDREEMRGNVFTNIDSAVVMDGDQRES